MKRIPRLSILLGLLLLGSMTVNFFVGRTAWRYYREAHSVRLNPLGLSFFPTDASQPVETEGNQRVVVFYGDSRAAQWPFPDQPELTADFVFIDRGINTQSSSQVAGRFDGHIRPLEPDIIVLQLCVNDLKTLPLFPEAGEEIIENCKANIQEIVGKSGEIGATIILTTIFPLGEVPPERLWLWSPEVSTAVLDVNRYIQSLEGEGVIVLDAFAILAGENDIVQEAYQFDLLHINEKGYEALNEALADILILVE